MAQPPGKEGKTYQFVGSYPRYPDQTRADHNARTLHAIDQWQSYLFNLTTYQVVGDFGNADLRALVDAWQGRTFADDDPEGKAILDEIEAVVKEISYWSFYYVSPAGTEKNDKTRKDGKEDEDPKPSGGGSKSQTFGGLGSEGYVVAQKPGK